LKSNYEPSSSGGNARLPEPIAIVGMGGVFPGASSLAEFWHLIERGHDTCRPVPAGRWLLDPGAILSAAPGAPDTVLTNRGCFIEDPSLAGELDPMFQLLIRAGQAAFADARTGNLNRSDVGVILGNIALPTEGASALSDEVLAPLYEQSVFGRTERKPGLATNALNRYVTGLPAGLLGRSLDLGGACYTLDAACASSHASLTA